MHVVVAEIDGWVFGIFGGQNQRDSKFSDMQTILQSTIQYNDPFESIGHRARLISDIRSPADPAVQCPSVIEPSDALSMATPNLGTPISAFDFQLRAFNLHPFINLEISSNLQRPSTQGDALHQAELHESISRRTNPLNS